MLVTTCPDAKRTDLVGWVHNHGVQELAVPRRILTVETIPVLGTGKTDYVKVQKTVEASDLTERDGVTIRCQGPQMPATQLKSSTLSNSVE